MTSTIPSLTQIPKISVVVPSYNQGAFLAETLASIVYQDYESVELIVIDGGSSDNSLDVIREFDSHIDYWVSEPDSGQCGALIKGFAKASGDIFCWVCSDDQLLPGTLRRVAKEFRDNPEIELVYGDTEYLYPNGERVVKPRIGYHYQTMLRAFNIIAQPSSFFSAAVYRRVGGLDESLHYAMDYDLFVRFGPTLRWRQLKESLSLYRLHKASKTVAMNSKFNDEWWRVREKALGRPIGAWDGLLRWLYTARVVWSFLLERGVLKLGYDRKKYLLD